MEENNTPGIAPDGISSDIFGTPSGAAWDAAKLMFGDWLELVFNDAGSGSATIMTYIAGYMNFLAYVLITVIMAYVLFASVIKTASEGKPMGGYSAVWVPLRTFLACFLIFPVGIGQASTISFIQVAVAWLGGVGSNAADNIASFVVNNIQRKAFTTDSNINGYQAVMDMTDMGYCAAGFNNSDLEFDAPAEFYGQVMGTPQWELHSPNASGMTIEEPKAVAISPDLASQDYSSVGIGHKGLCGNITVNAIEGESEIAKEIMEVALETQVKVYEQVVKPIVDTGYNAATIRLHVENNNRNDAEGQVIRNAVMEAVRNQMALMTEYEDRVSEIIVGKMNDKSEFVDFKDVDGIVTVAINPDKFNDKGWAYLGGYYTILSSAIAQNNQLSYMAQGITTSSNIDGCKQVKADRKSIWNGFGLWGGNDDEVCGYNEVYGNVKVITDLSGQLNRTSSNLDRKLAATCTDVKNCDTSLLEKGFAAKIGSAFTQSDMAVSGSTSDLARTFIGLLGWGGNDVANWGLEQVDTGNGSTAIAPGALFISDPITFTSMLGHDTLYNAKALQFILRTTGAVADGASNTGVPVLNAVTAVIGGFVTAVVDFLTVTLVAIYPQAATMAYFLPLLPALIWAMSFLSWLLMYAEAIFNAPLAVTLMATPEGDGIAGSRMERKIAMLAALILKPAMLVTGMMLSMMILSIGFVFLNQIFWIASDGYFTTFDPIGIVALITTWFTIITVFMHNTFKIIPTFADNSLEWFLGGLTNKFGNDLDNTTAGEFKSSAGSTQSLGNSTARSIGVFAKGEVMKNQNTVGRTAGKDKEE